MIIKYIAVSPDEVPKDLPHNFKTNIKLHKYEGINIGDPKLGHIKDQHYETIFSYKDGTIKKGSEIKSTGCILSWVFSSEEKALNHINFYKNNPRYDKNVYKKFIIVKVFNLYEKLSIYLAVRLLLKKKFNYKNLYSGFPFIIKYFSIK